ncbi:sigma 54-interacting transcriptional regulator [candidate division KSB1 bacterium]|nr:sigma 54-interacting transcriptional regulator [candidate division KSB1 bacterium]
MVDSELKISMHNPNFIKMLNIPQKPVNQYIYDVLPESIGLDSIFNELRNNERKEFILEKVNRTTGEDKCSYLDIIFYSTGCPENSIFLLINDISKEICLKKQVIQQNYNILLLESQNFSKGNTCCSNLLGNSDAIKRVRNIVSSIATIPKATIHLKGESGTGKSMIARLIHAHSNMPDKPFIEINCAAIPETLLEAELFGYERGAFTNAFSAKPGLLEEANNGTLFLDEIGDMPLKVQAKLLSFLETRKFRRLGSTRELQVEIKLISASNQDLINMIKKGEFREDLFYRLNVVNIEIPPLREMGQDIIVIAEHFIKIFNIEFKKNVTKITDDAKEKLMAYHWSGNVRELRNVIERAMIFTNTTEIDASDINLFNIFDMDSKTHSNELVHIPSEGIAFQKIEKNLLNSALKTAKGNQSKAAKLLNMSRDTFRYRLEKYHLI